jgi:SAM-dependent methyltransferase
VGVQERLSLQTTGAHTVTASEHVHRYHLASKLCRGLRVVDLACGSGYGSSILAETTTHVHGVDYDAGTIDTARVELAGKETLSFEVADALDFLNRAVDFEAIVCFEGLEHLPDPEAVLDVMARHASSGKRLLLSVPNSRGFGEENQFHVTDYGYEEALAAFARFDEHELLYQFIAEGSLMRGGEPADVEGEFLLLEHGEREYANHFIACVNFQEELAEHGDQARMHLNVAPVHNRHMRSLEGANKELWRENARLGRSRLGHADSAGAAILGRLAHSERQRAELEEELAHRTRQLRLLETPRHQAVENLRTAAMSFPVLYSAVRRLWNLRSIGRRGRSAAK